MREVLFILPQFIVFFAIKLYALIFLNSPRFCYSLDSIIIFYLAILEEVLLFTQLPEIPSLLTFACVSKHQRQLGA